MKRLLPFFLFPLLLFAQQQVQIVSGMLTLNLSPGNNSFKVIIGQNVTSVVITNPTPGTLVTVNFTENATGGFTVAFGGNISNPCTVTTSANAVTICQFQYDASSNTWNGINGSAGGGGLTQVATTPTACAGGAQFYNTTLQQYIYCPATNTPITTSGMIVQGQSAKIFLDGTVTSGSATVTSAGQANFLCPNASYPCSTVTAGSDVGLKIFATNMCNPAQCDFINDPSSSTILPSTQTKVGRIATVNSATSVTVDCAAPGNCVSPNASATNTGNAVVLYGPDSTAALNAAFTTAATSQSGCPAVIIPQGIYFFNLPVFSDPIAATAVCNNGLIKNVSPAGHYFGGGGTAILGYGGDASILTPTPDFTNPNARSGCVGGATINETWMNWSVQGWGQNLVGQGQPCSNLVLMPSIHATNMVFHGWGSRTSGGVGVNFNNGYGQYTDIEVFGMGGGSACSLSAPGVYVNIVCGLGGGTGGPGAALISGGQTSNSSFLSGNNANSAQIEVAGTWISVNDQITSLAINSSPSDDIKIDSGATAYITNLQNTSGGANSKGIETVGTGQAWLTNYHHTGASIGQSVTNAGVIHDGGNNSFAGPITNTGSWFNEGASANAIVITAAKLVLSAGWGSTAAWTALSGANAPIQGTITNSGTGQAASPTITYTFPTPYPVAPFSCTATQTGGTNASLAPYTASSLTATGVTFTATGTPTASSTEIIQITCVTP